MECKNHLSVAAVDRCAGCAEPFCFNCLVEIRGQKYCGSCKVLTIQGQPAVLDDEEGTIPCKEANEALTLAIVSLFCFGFILGPVAVVKAQKARKMMDENPELAGSGKVAAATVIGIASMILSGLNTFNRITNTTRHIR